MQVLTTLYRVTHHGNSRNGNPSYRLATNDGDFLTKTDAMVSYSITNLERFLPCKVTLTMTPAKRVYNVELS